MLAFLRALFTPPAGSGGFVYIYWDRSWSSYIYLYHFQFTDGQLKAKNTILTHLYEYNTLPSYVYCHMQTAINCPFKKEIACVVMDFSYLQSEV